MKKLSTYTAQDEIIAYLHSGEKGNLSPDLVVLLDKYNYIHTLRKRYHQKKQIVEMLLYKYNNEIEKLSRANAYKLINEAEYVFPKVEKFNIEYERLWLMEVSRANIALAFKSGKSELVTKAAMAHAVISGMNKDNSEIPDFDKLESHQYQIILPDAMKEYMRTLMAGGAINLADIMPNMKTIDVKANEGTGT